MCVGSRQLTQSLDSKKIAWVQGFEYEFPD